MLLSGSIRNKRKIRLEESLRVHFESPDREFLLGGLLLRRALGRRSGGGRQAGSRINRRDIGIAARPSHHAWNQRVCGRRRERIGIRSITQLAIEVIAPAARRAVA